MIKRNNKGQFIKGQQAWNKGLHIYMGGKCFEKGQIPWNKGKHTGNYGNGFKKGVSSWNKGKHFSVESKIKMSLAHKGQISSMKGKKHSKETKEIISKKNKGKHYSLSTEFKKGIKVWNKGKKGIMPTVWNKGKHSDYMKGKNHWNWKGGSTPKNVTIRLSLEYKLWREAVFKRDNYTCQTCGKRGVIIHADHIKPFAYFPELRFEISNGRTLCISCHKKTESYFINNYRDKEGRYITYGNTI